ncbi:MAG: endolytic transglycosylase MltG [Candidatus Saccharibacteria bacterium]|nr:endolytic transglycosylase MltG [Candidatus Saccharibacteria bacterium]
MKIIGLDIGTKRIGVAKADSTTRIAMPVGYLEVDGSEWQKIARIANLNNTNWFVLGLPRSNEGNETKQTLYVRAFAKDLLQKIPNAKIRFQDESLTSVEAEKRLKARKKPYQKGDIDAEAASIILQDFLEGFKESATSLSKNLSRQREREERVSPVTLAHWDANHQKQTGTNEAFPRKMVSQTTLQTIHENVKVVGKKESDKVKMSAMKTKHKIKKWPIFLVLALIVGGAIGGFFVVQKIREHNAEERRKEYARQEAEMKAEVFSFTIRPGETIYDVKKALQKEGYSDEDIDNAFVYDYDFDFLKKRPAGASLEGYLYGETYEFYKGVPIEDILTKYLEGMSRVISENNLEARYAEKGLSLFEGITLASIVQKESPAGEQATVAQVFLSRLGYGWKLGSDVTVSYAIDAIDPNRTVYQDNAAALAIDSCYNTRLYTGLPCGPIANPNLESLLAVANPSDTSYLYFLTGDDGLMYYSYTESEHNQNAALHCQSLCNISL